MVGGSLDGWRRCSIITCCSKFQQVVYASMLSAKGISKALPPSLHVSNSTWIVIMRCAESIPRNILIMTEVLCILKNIERGMYILKR
jgi:hypothetical protein